MLINLFVAASNFSLFLFTNKPKWFMYVPMVASTLYHLSERKHGLPGIYPLNNYHIQFIWLDRIAAFASVGYVLYKCWNQPKLLNILLPIGLFGLANLAISEHDIISAKFGVETHVNQYLFALTHSIWHCCAFYCLTR